MKLPFSLPFGKKEIKNYFLALLLQDEKAGAVIFEETNGTIRVVGRSEEHFPTSLNEVSFEELLDIVDKAISTAEESLPENIQTEKTIFGVKQNWVLDGKIKKEYLTTLKKICDELTLTPIGFLIFTEAIIHLLQQEEGAPVSAVLVEIGKKLITISLIRAGRFIEIKQVPIETQVVNAVDNALKHFTDVEILPSRIILFNQENNERLAQSFIKHTWSKTLPFLHVPQVTILPAGFETKGILTGIGVQMGLSITNENEHIPLTARKNIELEEDNKEESFNFAKHSEELPMKKKEITNPIMDDLEKQEISEAISEITLPEKKLELIHDDLSTDFFGFVKNKDITGNIKKSQKPQADNFETPTNIEETFAEIPEEVKEEITFENKPTGGLPINSMLLFSGLKRGLQTIPWKKVYTSILAVNLGKKPQELKIKHGEHEESSSHIKLYASIITLLLIIIGGILAYIFTISANVSLAVTPKVITDQQSVTFSTDGVNNFSQNILGVQKMSVDEKGALSENTTATKEIGNPAKGSITIFNADSNPASLSANTTIIASNGLKFSLDSAVNVPASNGDPTDPQSGKASISVTATDIGPNYNLPSGTKFTFTNNSQIAAKNDSPFSGGTKQEINVVAQADIDKLLADFIKNLENKAKTDMQGKLDDTTILLPFFTSESLTNKTLSNKVGDQAKNLSITATVSYETLGIKKSDIDAYTKQHLKDQLQSAGTITSNGLQSDITDIKQNKDTTTAIIKMKAILLPTIGTTDLVQKIAGKSFTQAKDILLGNNQVANVTISLTPTIPLLPKILPRLTQHIHIIIVSNE